MKVKDLIKQLETMDPESIVIMSKDSEGNRYSPLDDILPCKYQKETNWHGEIFIVEADDDPEDYDGMEDAICFWPVN